MRNVPENRQAQHMQWSGKESGAHLGAGRAVEGDALGHPRPRARSESRAGCGAGLRP